MGAQSIHDPSNLFDEEVLVEDDIEIDWSNVDRPETIPENENEATIDLAEWMIRTGASGPGSAITDRGEFMVAMVTATEPDIGIIGLEVDDYVTKPVTCDELTKVVQQLVARRDYEDQLADYFSFARKRGALEDEKSPSELDQHEELQRLETRLLELRDELDDIRSRIRDEDEVVVFNDPGTDERFDPGPDSGRGP